jgi:hypothetical protein
MDRTLGANYDSSTGVRLFTDGPPGTTVEQNFLNGVQEELIHAIESFAVTPSISDNSQLMNAIGLLGRGMCNGKIVPSVAGNNLTVAIKTLNGNDPSTTNPVYVRIGDYLRKISAALYITVTGGTNNWHRISHTYDLFVYLGWSSTNQRVEISLCPQPTYRAYPAANPAAPETRRLMSASGSNSAASFIVNDLMQVCGRIDSVVESAANNFTSVTTSNVISYPIYHTNYLSSPEVPVKTNAADTTPVFSTNTCYYYLNDKRCHVEFSFKSDGGADGAGVAGLLGMNTPFLMSTSIIELYISCGLFFTAGFDASHPNDLLVYIVSAAYGTLTRPVLFGGGAIVAGTQLGLFTPSQFPNGDKHLIGSFSYEINV